MNIRLDYLKHADPEPLVALSGLSGYLHLSDLDSSLLLLIELRASQINGCAYCVDMHTKELMTLGEENSRIYMLTTWRESDDYTDAEKAALAWTEAVTELRNGHDLQADYDRLALHFDKNKIVLITLAIVAINGWNRMSIAFGRKVGSYAPGDLTPVFAGALAKLRS